MFEGLYIADSKNNLTFQYLVFPHVPSFSSLVPTLNSKFASHSQEQCQLVETGPENFICSYCGERYIIYLLCSTRELKKAFNPLLPFVFIDRLVETMGEYFGTPLTPTKISAHNDTLTLLLHEMIADGFPNVTEFNNLQDLVSQKSLLSKILKTSNQLATAAANNSLSSLSQGSSSAPVTESNTVPWRKSNVKYTLNEMFVDVIESVNVVLKPKKRRNSERLSSAQNFDSAFYSTSVAASPYKLVPVTGSISGQIDFLSHISGVPEMQIRLNSASSLLEAPQFHRAIDVNSWLRNKSLSFVPADGPSTLMTYLVDLDNLPEKTQLAMLGMLEFDCQFGLGINKDEFELRITSSRQQAVPKFEHISVSVFAYALGKPDDYDPPYDSQDASYNTVTKMKTIRVTDGDFHYKGNGEGQWTLKSLTSGTQSVLRLAMETSEDSTDESSHESDGLERLSLQDKAESEKSIVSQVSLSVDFQYKGSVPSGLKVDSLEMISCKGMAELVKPYKGVRYITKSGNYSIRVR